MELIPMVLNGVADVSTIAILLWLLRLDRRVYRLEILREKEI